MRIVAEKTIHEYWEKHSEARGGLEAWIEHVRRAKWDTPQDLAKDYGSDTVQPDNRAIFNISKNRYRIIAHIHYRSQILFILFVGSHAEYDRIDARTI